METPENWVAIRLPGSGRYDDASAPGVFLLPASARTFAEDIARIASTTPPAADNIRARSSYRRDELTPETPQFLYFTRKQDDNGQFIEARVFAGQNADSSVAVSRLSLADAREVAAAIRRGIVRPVAPKPYGARWRVIESSLLRTIYADTVSLRRPTATSAELWVRYAEYVPPRERVTTGFFEFRCNERRFAMSQLSVYEVASGRTINATPPDDSGERWRAVAPESLSEILFSYACRRPVPRQ